MNLNLPTGGKLVTTTGSWTEAMWAWMRDITAQASSVGTVTNVTATAPIASSGGATPNISLNDTAVTPATYGDSTHVGQFTVDQKGRLTFAASVAISAGTVTTTGSPANGNLTKFSGATSITNGDLSGDVTTSGTLATTLANTAVTPATYGDASHVGQFTVDAKGRLTFAGNVAISASGGGSTVIGLDRVLGDGATTAFNLADLAEYVVTVSDAGAVVDPTLYALSADRSQVQFTSAPTAGHVLTFEYVEATI